MSSPAFERSPAEPPPADRCRVDVHADDAGFLTRLADDVRRGLGARPRWLPPKYFYDAAGSVLFDRITELPEYYLTRVEEGLIRELAGKLMRRLRPRDIVELGPGSCHKVRWLLDAAGTLVGADTICYVPMDLGRDGLARAIASLIDRYPIVHVHAVIADFERHLQFVPPPTGRRLVLFFGSTIGNFEPQARRILLAQLRDLLGPDGRLLLGVDLVKDHRVLRAAYDDAAGVTAAFNRNILHVLNRALDGDFHPEAFRHLALYNAEASRIEMHLVADQPQRVQLRKLPLTVELGAGESIWTESSYKFTRASTEAMFTDAGLAIEAWYTDRDQRFGLVLARPA